VFVACQIHLVQLPEKIDKKKNKTAYDFVKDELKANNPTIFDTLWHL
jgi:adenine-specific DNA-methyltransferase